MPYKLGYQGSNDIMVRPVQEKLFKVIISGPNTQELVVYSSELEKTVADLKGLDFTVNPYTHE